MKDLLKKKIIDFAASIKIEKCSIAHYSGKSAVVCLFPYFSGYREGNLSLYAHSLDYHKIISEKLKLISDFIKSIAPSCTAECFCDIGPEVDRLLAYRAGLGFYGKNGMLINSEYGSFFFIGYVLCDLNLTPDAPIENECMGCGKCFEACPGGALSASGFDISKCASHISQKKGTLTKEEEEILKKSGLIFGCDACQKVCPHNKEACKAMKEFTENLMSGICLDDIKSLTNRQFSEKYGNRAFSWRGKKLLERNLELLS